MKTKKIITKVPAGYKWTGTTRLSSKRIENIFVEIIKPNRANKCQVPQCRYPHNKDGSALKVKLPKNWGKMK